MIYKAIIDYHVLYITPLRTPLLEISRVFLKPTPRVLVSATIITRIFGLPPVLIVIMPLFLAFRLCTCPLVICRLRVGMIQLFAISTLLPAASMPPLLRYHASLSAIMQKEMLKKSRSLFGRERNT